MNNCLDMSAINYQSGQGGQGLVLATLPYLPTVWLMSSSLAQNRIKVLVLNRSKQTLT